MSLASLSIGELYGEVTSPRCTLCAASYEDDFSCAAAGQKLPRFTQLIISALQDDTVSHALMLHQVMTTSQALMLAETAIRALCCAAPLASEGAWSPASDDIVSCAEARRLEMTCVRKVMTTSHALMRQKLPLLHPACNESLASVEILISTDTSM